MSGEPIAAQVDWHEQRFRAAVLNSAGLKRLPPPAPLIRELLQRDSLAELYGKPGLGKTFAAASMACCVATGLPWMGHEVEQGRVVYVVAENASGTGQRAEAWEEYHRTTVPPDALVWLPLAVNLAQPEEVEAFTRLAAEPKPVFVVFDTRARCTVGVEENSARDLGQVAAAVEALRELHLYKPPGVAETIDWAHALAALGVTELDERTVAATLGTVLKYREDQARVEQSGIADLVKQAFERGLVSG